MDLSGRVALITGGAGHIGQVIAAALLEAGATVALCDRDEPGLERVCSTLSSQFSSGELDYFRVDFLDENETRGLISKTMQRFQKLQIIVHCAAFVGTTEYPGWAEYLDRQSVAAWDAALRVNVTAAFVMTQEAAPVLKQQQGSSVVYISSIYGLCGPDMSLYEGTAMKHPAAYGVSKAGLLQLARFFATTLAPEVRVNAISPGGIWRRQPEAFHTRYKVRTPLGRMGVEEDLKGAVLYLASDLSSYVTGQNLVVDGGWCAW